MADIPDRMRQNGRGVDGSFGLEEFLYRRFTDSEIKGQELHTDQLPFHPAMSVNRQKYSEPQDVLYPNYFQSCGVFQFRVNAIPPRYETDGGVIYEWAPVHVPEPENYAHSEVRTLKNGLFDPGLKLHSSLVKKWFREYLRDRAQIIILPGAAVP